MKALWRWLPLTILAGCVQPEPTAPVEAGSAAVPGREIGILVFGDHGYHLDYLEAKDYEPPRSREQFIAARTRRLARGQAAAGRVPPTRDDSTRERLVGGGERDDAGRERDARLVPGAALRFCDDAR